MKEPTSQRLNNRIRLLNPLREENLFSRGFTDIRKL